MTKNSKKLVTHPLIAVCGRYLLLWQHISYLLLWQHFWLSTVLIGVYNPTSYIVQRTTLNKLKKYCIVYKRDSKIIYNTRMKGWTVNTEEMTKNKNANDGMIIIIIVIMVSKIYTVLWCPMYYWNGKGEKCSGQTRTRTFSILVGCSTYWANWPPVEPGLPQLVSNYPLQKCKKCVNFFLLLFTRIN